MRIQLLSDLHFEFHHDNGQSFIRSLDPRGVDVLVLAGDIAGADGLFDALRMICRQFHDSPVIYVYGNHEFYHASLLRICPIARMVESHMPNFHWLENSIIQLDGFRFLGATLWFPRSDADRKTKLLLNDFNCIQDFESWVYDENLKAVGFLRQNLQPGDIVVTHHIPSPSCVSERYKDSALNPFFVCDLTKLILERRPRLWMFGHTHDTIEATIGVTEMRCNPFGYAYRNLNPRFQDRLIIEV